VLAYAVMSTPVGLTLTEAATLLTKLEGRTVTPRHVRAVLVLDTRGRAIERRRLGETRVYTAEDVALVRLALRLRGSGVSPTVARIVAACLRAELVAAWRSRRGYALAVTGLRGVVVPPHRERPSGVIAWVPLRAVWAGIEDAIRTTRRTQPEIWQWKAQPATALAAGGGF